MTSPNGRSSEIRRSPPVLHFPQVVLDPALKRHPEQQPGLGHRARHHGHLGELLVSVLRAIAAPQGHNQAGDDAAVLESGGGQGPGDDVRHEGVGCHEDMGARHQDTRDPPPESFEEVTHALKIRSCERGETGERGPHVTVERRRQAPDAALPGTKLELFLFGVFHQPVGRVRHDSVNAVRTPPLKPGKTVLVVEAGLSVNQRRPRSCCQFR